MPDLRTAHPPIAWPRHNARGARVTSTFATCRPPDFRPKHWPARRQKRNSVCAIDRAGIFALCVMQLTDPAQAGAAVIRGVDVSMPYAEACLCAGAGRAWHRPARPARRRLSVAPDPADRAVCRRRRRRLGGAHRRQTHRRRARPDRRGRRPRRRRRHHRHRAREKCRAGRLYAAARPIRTDLDQSRHLSETALRSREGFCADHDDDRLSLYPGGQSLARRENGGRARRARQEQARPTELRHDRASAPPIIS